MANVRQIEFITGVETATQPAAQDPVNDEDLITLGYANNSYYQGKQSVETVNDVRAIDSADCNDGDVIFVRGIAYSYWFDSGSTESDDGFFYLLPTDAPGTGRWRLNSILDKQITLTDQTQSTDKDTGAVVLEGGLGVEKNVNVGGILNVVTSATINNLTTTGTTTFVNSTDLEVTDGNITVNKGGDQAAADLVGAGLTVEMSDADDAKFEYNSGLASKWRCGDISAKSEILTAAFDQQITGLKQFNREHQIQQITTPVANPSGGVYLYAKSDNELYIKKPSGVELPLVSGSASGGGGGGSLSWVGAAGSAPVESNENGVNVYLFTDGGEEDLYATIKVPESYVPGIQITMKNYAWNEASTNFYLLATQTTLIRPGVDLITSTTNQHTDNSGDLASSAAGELTAFTTDLTSAIGQINGVAVSAGDLLKVRLTRGTPTGTEQTADIKFIPDTTEVSFI